VCRTGLGGVLQICPPGGAHGNRSLRHVGSLWSDVVPPSAFPRWRGARCCTPVPPDLWLMENLEYPVQSIPQGRLPLATRRWGYDRAGETREDRLNRSRWHAGAAPFDRVHWGSRTSFATANKAPGYHRALLLMIIEAFV
jgi:hypothetical protein